MALNCMTALQQRSLSRQPRAQQARAHTPKHVAILQRGRVCPSLHTSMQQHIARAAGPAENPEVSIEEMFAAELQSRAAAEAKQAEVAAAAVFDGAALLALLRKKYGRSYDVSLVQRTYLGKVFVALNIMWKYMEQQSFSYSEEQYMQRLEYVAAALVSWGAVTTVQDQLAATKKRPRVGCAVSIMLDVPEDRAREWIAG